jgi:hypothetical protein
MSLVGTYSVSGPSSSITLSYQYSTVDELLIQIPDNTGGEIGAGDVRDAVYSLWSRMDGFSASVNGLTVSSAYIGLTPSTIVSPIGGILPGATFSGSVQDVIDTMLYPYVSPSTSIGSLNDREFGSSMNVSLNWNVVRGSNNVISPILVNGASVTATGLSQSGVTLLTTTHSISPVGPSEVKYFSMTASDGISSVSSTQSLTFMNRIYWGTVVVPSQPNLTTNPGSASLVTAVCIDSTIRNLTGAGANGQAFGNILSTNKSRTYNNINGGGNYLVFAWPSTVAQSTTPAFTVNGMVNTSFTNVRTSSPLANTFGFITNYEVWVSNTRYNSPVNIVIT